eukprot:TRINITY_DN26809_c0_g1_i1.p1 TRINITY_DN26809_c0_g1~~TRINITY_DN26809_c0_g1_i1.p1  ORF type:complete len:1375 (-),score=202.02 TRINITY_DN26809_c0_g1_i1:286-4410(-)
MECSPWPTGSGGGAESDGGARICSCDYQGPVLALSVWSVPDSSARVVVAGVGPDLHVFADRDAVERSSAEDAKAFDSNQDSSGGAVACTADSLKSCGGDVGRATQDNSTLGVGVTDSYSDPVTSIDRAASVFGSVLRRALGGTAAHIHGIRVDPLRSQQTALVTSHGDVVTVAAVFGPQYLTLCKLIAPALSLPRVQRLVSPARLPDWPLDVAWLGVEGLRLVVAFARHFVEVLRYDDHVDSGTFVKEARVPGPAGASFLYSGALAMLPSQSMIGRPPTHAPEATPTVRFACGTFDGYIHVWQFGDRQKQELPNQEREQQQFPPTHQTTVVSTWSSKATAPTTLEGHDGSVFRVRLFLDGSVILSASDDRTARLWRVRGVSGQESDANCWSCEAVYRGHGTRVWDALLVGSEGSTGFLTSGSIVATACEDSSVRLFLRSGEPLRELQGHRTRGVRCVEVLQQPTPNAATSIHLVSGGEDGAVKVWPLATVVAASAVVAAADVVNEAARVEPATSSKTSADVGPARCSWTVPETSDWIREVTLTSRGEAVVATNFGRLYRVMPTPEGGEACRFELIFNAGDKSVCDGGGLNFTCLSTWAGINDAAIWCGCADGRTLVLRPAAVSPSEAAITAPTPKVPGCGSGSGGFAAVGIRWAPVWGSAFENCRVSAVFAGRDGHALLTDHVGGVVLWRSDRHTESMSTLARWQLVRPDGGQKLRAQCAMLVQVSSHVGTSSGCASLLEAPSADAVGNLVWILGDEHGHLHAVYGSDVPTRAAGVHSGKVMSLSVAKTDVHDAALFFSGGGDGAVVKHRLQASGEWQRLASVRPGCGLRNLAYLVGGDEFSDGAPTLVGAFQGADFVLWDMQAGAEHWRYRCGGAKRPSCLFASRVGAGGRSVAFTFAFSSGSKALEIFSAYPVGHAGGCSSSDLDLGGNSAAPVGLRAPLHGRELHAVTWLISPTAEASGLLATASEDGTMRLARCDLSRGAVPSPVLTPLETAERHPGAVRALTVVRVGGASILISGGAKSALRVYLVEGGELRFVWSPPALGAACGAAGGVDPQPLEAAVSEERVMAVTAAETYHPGAHSPSLTIVAATSSGMLGAWRVRISGSNVVLESSGTMRASTSALLCARCFMAGSRACVLVGSADGAVLVHGLENLLASSRSSRSPPEPSLRLELHDAGVNDLAIVQAGTCSNDSAWSVASEDACAMDWRVLLATAGDDQRIVLTLFGGLTTEQGAQMRVLASRSFDGAHTSSVRSLSWTPPFLLSLGLDRRMHSWSVKLGQLDLHHVAQHETSCSEPAAVTAVFVPTSVTGERVAEVVGNGSSVGLWCLALAGRGLELATAELTASDATTNNIGVSSGTVASTAKTGGYSPIR